MNRETRHEFADRLDAATRTLTKVAEEMADRPDATHDERVFARTMQSNVNTYFNPPLAVFRVATQNLPPEN
jgi:hypothetical protein